MRRPTRNSPAPATRRFRTHCVSPRGATRQCSPAKVSRLTGVALHSPLLRPRTRSSRDPHTLMPARVSAATARLKTVRVNHPGSTYLRWGTDSAMDQYSPRTRRIADWHFEAVLPLGEYLGR